MKYYIFKLNDWNINELKKLLNNRELFRMYENYQRIKKIFFIIIVSYPIVLFSSAILTQSTDFINDNAWFSLFCYISTIIYIFAISPIYEWQLTRKMNYDIYKELDTNLSLKKFYEKNDFEILLANMKSVQSLQNHSYDGVKTKREVKDLPKYLKEFSIVPNGNLS